MATVGSLVVRIGADISGLERGLGLAQARLRSAGSQMRSIGSGLTLGLTAPLVGVASAALSSAAGFEQSMNLMQSMSGATGEQMAMLQAQALELGRTTSFSAGDAAEAMLELSKAGMTVSQTSAAIPGVLDLAAANIGLADAATITANTINTFGLEASAAAEVANVLAGAANASSADVSDLALGMKMAGAVFASNGQSVDDLAASLAILANNGIAGSDAGTSLKVMLMRLAAPTAEAASAMDSLGLQIYDSTGAMLPFGDVVAQLETATANLTDEQRNAALSTIFGADAIRAATILAGEGGAAFDAMAAAVSKEGSAALLADAQMSGLSGAFKYFKGSIDSLLISTAQPYLDTLGSMIRSAADLAMQFTTLPPNVQRFAAVLTAVLAVGGPLLMILGTMATALAGLLSPVGLVLAAVVALGIAWATNFGGIRDVTMQVWAVVQPYLTQALAWLQSSIPAALAMVKSAWEGVWNGLAGPVQEAEGTLSGIWSNLQTVWANVVALVSPSIPRLQQAFSGLPDSLSPLGPALEGMGSAFSALWTAVQPILSALGQALAAVAAMLSTVLPLAINTFAEMIERGAAIVGILVDQIAVTVGSLAEVITGMVELVSALIEGDWSAAWEAAQGIVDTVTAAISATWENLLALVTEIIGGIFDIVVNTLSDLGVNVDTALSGIRKTWQTVWNALRGPVDSVTDAVQGVWDRIQSFWEWIRNVSIPNPFAGWYMPGWLGGGDVPGNALGTPRWPGGLTWVGEFGPELVSLPSGSQVFSARESLAMAGAASTQNVTFNVTVHQDLDWEALRWRLQELMRRRGT